MLLFSFPAHSFEQLANLKKLIRDWGHTTEDWLEYILEWRDQILEYEEQNLLDSRWSNQGPVYEHFWHGQQWKMPKMYEQQSEDLALIIGAKGQAILDVFAVMEVWVKRKPNTKYPSSLKIKRMFQKAKHLAFLLKAKIDKEWQRLEESEKPAEPQPTAKKKKGPKLPPQIQQMFNLMTQLRDKGHEWKQCIKPLQNIDPKLTSKAFDSLIRRYNHHQKKTNLGQVD